MGRRDADAVDLFSYPCPRGQAAEGLVFSGLPWVVVAVPLVKFVRQALAIRESLLPPSPQEPPKTGPAPPIPGCATAMDDKCNASSCMRARIAQTLTRLAGAQLLLLTNPHPVQIAAGVPGRRLGWKPQNYPAECERSRVGQFKHDEILGHLAVAAIATLPPTEPPSPAHVWCARRCVPKAVITP